MQMEKTEKIAELLEMVEFWKSQHDNVNAENESLKDTRARAAYVDERN